MRVRAVRTSGVVGAVLVLSALTACTSDPVGVVATRVPAAPATSAVPSASAAPSTPPPTQDVEAATPVTVKCKKLVPIAVAREVAKDFAGVHGFEPDPASSVGRLGALDGVTCAWKNADGDRLEVAVAKPSSRDATALKNDLVDRSNSVPTYAGEAYFRVVDHVGEVDAFRGRTWILARSDRFYEPGDAIDVIAAADRALGFAAPADADPTPAPTGTAPTPTPTPTG